MERQLRASQRFLRGLVALSRFDDIRTQQFTTCLTIIQRSVDVSSDSGAQALEAIDQTLWTGTQVQRLQEAISEKIRMAQRDNRRSLQDFTQLAKYLDASMWTLLQSCATVEQKVRRLTELCGKLGLRRPTEATYAAIVWLAAFAFPSAEREPWKCLQEHKPWMKKFLQALPASERHLPELPSRQELLHPDFLRVAYPDGFIVPVLPEGLDFPEIDSHIRRFPLRKTNLNVTRQDKGKESVSSQVVPQMMEGVGKMLSTLGFRRGSPAKGEYKPHGERQARVNVLPLMDRPSAERTEAVAATSAERTLGRDNSEELSGAAAPVCGAATVEAQPAESLDAELGDLRAACLAPETSEEKDGSDGEGPVHRRPAKRSRGRPAGQQATLKRPAAAAADKRKLRAAASSEDGPGAKGQKSLKRPAAAGRVAASETPLAKTSTKKRPASVEVGRTKTDSEEGLQNFGFTSSRWGTCKAEFYSQKSYIRSWNEQTGKWVLVIGSTVPQHRQICAQLWKHVQKGLTREQLLEARERIVASL